MSDVIARLFVAGRPRTKGSLKPVHIKIGGGRCKVSLTEDHALSRPWLERVVRGLKLDLMRSKINVVHADAVEVHRFFRFDRRLSQAGGAGFGLPVPSQAGPWPVANEIGDVDKLTRAVLDALTQAGVLADDCLVVGGCELKRWCREGEEAGVEILVRPAGAWAAHVESIMLDGAL